MTGALFGTVFKFTATVPIEPEEVTAGSVIGTFLSSMASGAAAGVTYGAFSKGLVGTLFGGRGQGGEAQWRSLDEFLNRAMMG